MGSAIQPSVTGNAVSPTVTGTGVSPNDGYGIQGQGQAAAVSVLQQSAQAFGADS